MNFNINFIDGLKKFIISHSKIVWELEDIVLLILMERIKLLMEEMLLKNN